MPEKEQTQTREISLKERKLAAQERRTAVLEQIAQQNAQNAAARREKTAQATNDATFEARRAEINAIVRATRVEIGEQLNKLATEWEASTQTPQDGAAILRKFVSTLLS